MNCTLRILSVLLMLMAGGIARGGETRGYRVMLNKPASGELGEPESEAGSVTHRMSGSIQNRIEYAK